MIGIIKMGNYIFFWIKKLINNFYKFYKKKLLSNLAHLVLVLVLIVKENRVLVEYK